MLTANVYRVSNSGSSAALPSVAAYTSESYAQRDHLIAQWDGIDNVGTGVHDPAATVWKDLKGDLDMTLTDRGRWNARGNALYMYGGMGARGTKKAPAYKTIEVVYRMTKAGGRLLFISGISSRIVGFDQVSGTNKIYFNGDKQYSAGNPYISWTLDTASITSLAATYSVTNYIQDVFLNGSSQSAGVLYHYWNTDTEDFVVSVGDKSLTNHAKCWSGEIYAIRLYDTELTAEEIKANRDIDIARFCTKASSRYVQDGLVTQWDGIDNAGTGVHDPTATVWKDLKGDLDLTLTEKGAWNEKGNGLAVNGISAVGTTKAPEYKTIEVVYRRTNSAGRVLFSSGFDKRFVIFDSYAPRILFSGQRYTPYITKDFDANEIAFLAARYDNASNVTDIVCDGGPATTLPRNNTWGAGAVVMIGGRKLDETNYEWFGEVYAIRLYNRRLSRAELAENNRIDRQRFLSSDTYAGHDDLVSQWDGENNFGVEVPHNPDSPIWKDLAGTRDLVLTTNGSWTAAGNGLAVNGASATNSAAAPGYRTVEVACRHTRREGKGAFVFSSGNSGRQYVCYNWLKTGEQVVFSGLYAEHQSVHWAFADSNTVCTMAATYTNTEATAEFVYANGSKRTDGTKVESFSSCQSKFIVGDNKFDATTESYRPWQGDVYAIRLYNRELTEAEIAFNSAVDLKRVALSPKAVAWAGGDGDLGTAANWKDGQLPRFSDEVSIASGTVTSAVDQVFGSLALGGDASLGIIVPTDGETTPFTVSGALVVETGAGIKLNAAAFGKKHYRESVTLVTCGKDSSAALAALAENVTFVDTPESRRGTLSVVGGRSLVYTAPDRPGMAIIFR